METAKNSTPPFFNFLVMSASAVIVIAGIKSVASMINILLLSILIAQCINPLIVWLTNKKISYGVSIVITLFIVLGVGGGILTMVGSSIYGINQKIPAYSEHIGEMLSGIKQTIVNRGYDLNTLVPEKAISPERITGIITIALAAIATVIGNGFFIIILVIILLAELAVIRQKVEKKEYPEGSFMYRISEINKTSTRFIGITALMGLMQAVLNVIILLILGVDFAPTWGVLFFFFNFIPMIGFFLALLPPVLIALMDNGTTSAIIVFAGWYIINVVFDNFVKPKFLNKEFEVSFFVIILMLMFWSFVLGPLGAIISIPLTLTLKYIYEVYSGKAEKI